MLRYKKKLCSFENSVRVADDAPSMAYSLTAYVRRRNNVNVTTLTSLNTHCAPLFWPLADWLFAK